MVEEPVEKKSEAMNNGNNSNHGKGRERASSVGAETVPRPIYKAESTSKTIEYLAEKGNMPPSSYYDYKTQENGNPNPRMLRSNFYTLPQDPSTINSTGSLIGISLQPLSDVGPYDEMVPLIDEPKGPFRCSRCRCYINPYFTYDSKGSSTFCNLCKMENKLPTEMYAPVNQYGVRTDKNERYELHCGTYEFLASSEYHLRPNLVIPHYLLAIEMTYYTVSQGIFSQILSSLQSIISEIPSAEGSRIGIITYDNSMQIYKVPEDLTKELQIIQVTDANEVCMPLPLNDLCFKKLKKLVRLNFFNFFLKSNNLNLNLNIF